MNGVQNLIYIYLTLCFAMMIFNFAYMLYQKSTYRTTKQGNKNLAKKVSTQINSVENNNKVLDEHKAYLWKKLKNVSNLYAFEEILNTYNYFLIREYLNQIQDVFDELCECYSKKSSVSKAYLAYFISEFRIGSNNSKAIIKFLFDLLKEDYIYGVHNAMVAIYRLGNLKDILKAILIIDKKESRINAEVIEKWFMLYDENKDELAKALWKNQDRLSLEMKIAIISFITKIDSRGDWSNEMLQLLKNPKTEKILKPVLIKYFAEYYDERVLDSLYEILEYSYFQNKSCVIAAIKTLKNYPGDSTIKVLKDTLKSERLEFQIEAAETLSHLDVDYLELLDIYDGENQKAREILKYMNSKERKGVEVWK